MGRERTGRYALRAVLTPVDYRPWDPRMDTGTKRILAPCLFDDACDVGEIAAHLAGALVPTRQVRVGYRIFKQLASFGWPDFLRSKVTVGNGLSFPISLTRCSRHAPMFRLVLFEHRHRALHERIEHRHSK